MENVEEIIKDCIADIIVVDKSEVNLDTNLHNDLGVDSLDLMEIIVRVERDLDIRVSNEDAESIRTVKDLIDVTKKYYYPGL